MLVKSKSNNRSFSRKGYEEGGESSYFNQIKKEYSPFRLIADAAGIDYIGMWTKGNKNAKIILDMQEENIGRNLKAQPYTEAEIEPIAEIARHIDIAGSSARKHPERDEPRITEGPYGKIAPDRRARITNINRTLLQGKEIVQAAFTGEGIRDSRKDWGNNKIGFTLGQQNLKASEEEWQEILRTTINDSIQRMKQGLDPRKGIDVFIE